MASWTTAPLSSGCFAQKGLCRGGARRVGRREETGESVAAAQPAGRQCGAKCCVLQRLAGAQQRAGHASGDGWEGFEEGLAFELSPQGKGR